MVDRALGVSLKCNEVGLLISCSGEVGGKKRANFESAVSQPSREKIRLSRHEAGAICDIEIISTMVPSRNNYIAASPRYYSISVETLLKFEAIRGNRVDLATCQRALLRESEKKLLSACSREYEFIILRYVQYSGTIVLLKLSFFSMSCQLQIG